MSSLIRSSFILEQVGFESEYQSYLYYLKAVTGTSIHLISNVTIVETLTLEYILALSR